jgi:molybdopterin/thiamine biosynthesis adenylyltransferase
MPHPGSTAHFYGYYAPSNKYCSFISDYCSASSDYCSASDNYCSSSDDAPCLGTTAPILMTMPLLENTAPFRMIAPLLYTLVIFGLKLFLTFSPLQESTAPLCHFLDISETVYENQKLS